MGVDEKQANTVEMKVWKRSFRVARNDRNPNEEIRNRRVVDKETVTVIKEKV